MRQRTERPNQKRLQILDADEIEALYGRPHFTPDDRLQYFTLTQPERDASACLCSLPSQLYFMLQLAYFKAKQLFLPLPLPRWLTISTSCSRSMALPCLSPCSRH